MKKNVLLFPTSDWHTGGTTALHPNIRRTASGEKSLTEIGGWNYIDNPHFYPSSLQVRIWEHFQKSLDRIAEQRKDKLLYMLMVGDAIEGLHHHTTELVTRQTFEMVDTHIELLEYAKRKLNFKRGDLLAYLYGTSAHTQNEERNIAAQVDAYQYPDGTRCANFAALEINGVLIWAYHKGVSAGQGQTRGNACVAKMRQVYYECLQNGERVPEWIISGHTHDYHHAVWKTPSGKMMNYVILPPMQDKTRFAYDNLATNKNKVGFVTIEIDANGRSWINPPDLLESPRGQIIKL